MDILKWAAVSLAALVVLYVGFTALGAWRWGAATRGLVARLDAAAVSGKVAPYVAAELAGLPAPVRRYFERALTDGQPIIGSVDLAVNGTFNMGLEAPQWRPFTSDQRVVTNRPGFVWNARIMLFPLVPVRVHDAYVAGEGVLRPSALGMVPLGEVQGVGEIAKGELMRWFAEAVWYPTALLPSQGVLWDAVNATSATATMTDGPITLSMLFRFGADGLVSGIRIDARGALVKGISVMMPWEGRFRDYRPVDGMMIPFFGEVAWITPQGERPYFRGTVIGVTHQFGSPNDGPAEG
ncbi:MAG: DUF6544 family protein [Pseudotabrizicola sp.]|uniref:DUF6920 family protein n=1 Tax=Pseudotabrizicola sp. TaxID=2939647 RepID=UPI00273059D5|nr:DUF6544 family protein [Pseudotabrizicola sp.]MDP2079708.1 hypothetical protein [Pseudotabrizicola sp.]MDZ7574243.1 DUF6544 family protein [Pseudotabrizicola sp.]